ncbi:ankyrin [Peniophora sp. CONT]|nr:ankyrin [Peniophora sp. CONT]
MPPEYSDDPLNDARGVHDPLSGVNGEADLADDGSDESDVFIYPGAEPAANEEDESDDEEFRYPGADEPAVPAPSAPAPVPEATAQSIPIAPREPSPVVSPLYATSNAPTVTAASEETPVRSRAPEPTRAQLESLYAGASSGDLEGFQKLVSDVAKASECEPFALVNDATSRTGLTPLHAAASRGHLDIVKWLIEGCGAIPDLEDKEGETAVHKASLQGHIDIIKYLLPNKSEVHARDADGWTALHNACSKVCQSSTRHEPRIHGLEGLS